MFAQSQQLPVSCFRFNKVYTAADQLMGTHELVVDYLLNNIQGQNWLMHWTPGQDFTECMLFFPEFALDRVSHIRPLANFFQQHLMEDPAVMYRPRNEFIELIRACDMNRCNELGGWGLTTMSRLNNIGGQAIQETRTKVTSPTEVIHKYVTRSVPILGQQFVSPLARCVAPMTMGCNEADVLGNLLCGNVSGSNFLGSRNPMIRGLSNLVHNNMLGRYAPVGLTHPIGVAVQQDMGLGFGGLGIGCETGIGGIGGLGEQGLGYAQHAQNWAGIQSLNALNNCTPLNPLNVGNAMPGRIIQGLNQAVCQTLNPAVCEQQQTTSVKVCQNSPLQHSQTHIYQTSPVQQHIRVPLQQVPMVNKVVC